MSIFFIFGFLKPKSSLHYGSDQVTVVSFPQEELEGSIILDDIKISVDVVGEVDDEYEFLELIDFLSDDILGHLNETCFAVS